MKSYTLGQSKEQVLGLIPDKQIKLVQLDTSKVCVSRLGGQFYAFEQLCPHQKASLHQGFVTGLGEIVCPLHQYRFDLNTGQVQSGQCPDLKTFQTDLTLEGLKNFI